MGVVVALLLVAGLVVIVARRAPAARKAKPAPVEVKPRVKVELTLHRAGQEPVVVAGGSGRRSDAMDERLDLALELREISGEFCADVSASPDGVFIAGAREGQGPGHDRELGLLVLANRRRRSVLFQALLPRPNNPVVSNSGLVVVQCWGAGREPGSSLRGFTPEGKPVWVLNLRANVGESGVSPGGVRAFCTTYGSSHGEHSRRLFMLEAMSGRVLWSRDWPEALELRFEGQQLVATMLTEKGPGYEFRYEEDGTLSPAAEEALLRRQIGWSGADRVLVPLVREALLASPSRLEEAERLLAVAELETLEAVPRGKLLRMHGELHEARGELQEAAAAYREALEWYPRVGVKGRLGALEKRLR